jgi:hypothetical protein
MYERPAVSATPPPVCRLRAYMIPLIPLIFVMDMSSPRVRWWQARATVVDDCGQERGHSGSIRLSPAI